MQGENCKHPDASGRLKFSTKQKGKRSVKYGILFMNRTTSLNEGDHFKKLWSKTQTLFVLQIGDTSSSYCLNFNHGYTNYFNNSIGVYNTSR